MKVDMQELMPHRIAALTVTVLMLVLSRGAAAEPFATIQLATATTSDPTAVEPGTTLETAIVLEGATNTFNGIAAEHAYTRKHYPGWQWTSQALMNNGGRHYDVIDMISPKGETKTIYFGITDWFGKLE
jgi:hypothetical protein